MLNDFIGGGQVFLHKLRMFCQVLDRSFVTALLVSLTSVCIISYKPAKTLDIKAAMTYQKALFLDGFDEAMKGIRKVVNPKVKYYVHKIDAYTSKGIYAQDIETHKILNNRLFVVAHQQVVTFLKARLLVGLGILLGIFCLIYVV